MAPIEDHPLRYALANEIHARPFPALQSPSTGAYLAIKQAENASSRDRELDRQHLIDLLDRHGAPHPSPGATHYYGQVGRYWLKWESHAEFVTYTAFSEGLGERAFDPADFEAFPDDWLEAAPGSRLTSALIRVQEEPAPEAQAALIEDWFVSESLAVSDVVDRSVTVASDFRIDPAGHMRFAVFTRPDTGSRRIGRVVQRLCEIETYKTMSMLGFARVQSMSARLGEIDSALLRLVDMMSNGPSSSEGTLRELIALSSELENMSAKAAFRFSATRAYEAIVAQRIEVLREERFNGRQTFREFMMRRYDPAMRTVAATERRLKGMSERALRAGDLLRTSVDVERQAQNQKLLESMDKRADLQLRLQKTVEGLSVVAISYYAVNLVVYSLGPAASQLGLTQYVLFGISTPLTVLAVWWLVRRIRRSVE
ncbi:MAG: DUF3422 domain-containing protein [Rhodobacteraceae bacterium]|nr:DUF3422 domain-containing protein [Paracoccaceae bacterium]